MRTEPLTARATVGSDGVGVRVDVFLAEIMELFPRSQIPHRDVQVSVNGTAIKLSRKLSAGDIVEVTYGAPQASNIAPEKIDLQILFENDDVVVLDKPLGMVVHPGAGNWTGTLAQGLMYYLGPKNEFDSDNLRPGIVHRLDKETSGVIIAAKHPQALDHLAAQFQARSTRKLYLAVIKGSPRSNSGHIETQIVRDPRNRKRFAVSEHGGKFASTEFEVRKRYADATFVLLRPHTGRTHQLRVHMQHIGCPIVGDSVYGRRGTLPTPDGMLLHAYQLTIRLPGESDPRTFTARMPERFRRAMAVLSDRE